MAQAAKKQTVNQETALFDYVDRIGASKAGRLAVHIHLSGLRPHNRHDHHLRIAAATFDLLLQKYEGALFRLYNDDLVVICKGASAAEMDKVVLRLRYLFSDDPLLSFDTADDEGFCDWYDLETSHGQFVAFVRQLIEARTQFDKNAEALAALAVEEETTVPLDPPSLATIQNAIAQADLSGMVRRQPICAVVKDHKPTPVFEEIYTSIADLEKTLSSDYNILGNRWLFQDLTRYLDLRMIALLIKNDGNALHKAFSLNLNVSTLLASEFLDLHAALTVTSDNKTVIELQFIDVFSDMGSYLFACEFLHDHGYRICLDGISHLSLPYVERKRLGFDLVKLQWSADLFDQLQGVRKQELQEAVERIGPERLILCRCDSAKALEVGRSLGIGLYQGHLLDQMLAENVSKEETVQAMSKAMARQRTAARR